MDGVKNLLQEELDYALKVQKRYCEAILMLPRGSLWKKKVNNKEYYYLAYREGHKVKFDYLGKLSEQEIKAYQNKVEKRRRYLKLIKDVKEEIKFLKRVLKSDSN